MGARVGVGEVRGAEEDVDDRAFEGETIGCIGVGEDVAGRGCFVGREAVRAVDEMGVGAENERAAAPDDAGFQTGGRDAWKRGVQGGVFGADEIRGDGEIELVMVGVEEVEDCFEFGAVEAGVVLKRSIHVDGRGIGIEVDEAVEAVDECGRGTGDPAHSFAKGEIEGEGAFGAEIGIADLVDTGAGVKAVGKTLLGVGRAFAVSEGGAERPRVVEGPDSAGGGADGVFGGGSSGVVAKIDGVAFDAGAELPRDGFGFGFFEQE